MKLRNARIATRLGAGFGAILTILVAVVGSSIWLTFENKTRLVNGLELANAKAAHVAEMKSALLEGGIAMRNMLDFSSVERQKARVGAQAQRYNEARDRLLNMALTKEERALLDAIAALDKEVEGRYRLAIQQAENMNAEGAASLISNRIDPANMKAVAEMDKLVKAQQAAAEKVLRDSISGDRRLMLLLVGISGIAIAFGAGFAWVITRSITSPLDKAVAIAERVAIGDLMSDERDDARDEIGRLLDALQRMNQNLCKIVEDVRNGTDTITTGTRDVATGSADLARRIASQAGALEKTASSMEELTSTVHQNTENARCANELAACASNVAVRGGEIVSSVVSTMNSIKDSSRKVVDIVSVIDGIAFQTNILALNAAVEAARAGEQGRGFAVVAGEVRSLAQRAAAASREIKALIVNSMERVETGSSLVEQAGSTMDEIVGSVKKVTDIMAEILLASREQAAGIEHINQAIVHMEHVTQENANLVQEAARAASVMQVQSVALSDKVSVFQVVAPVSLSGDRVAGALMLAHEG